MKTFLTETISLIVCILAAAVVNWVLGPFPYRLDIAAAAAAFAFCWCLRSRTVPLLLCIEIGAALSWVSLYVFWFAIWTFHSVPAARACAALGSFILIPAKWVFELLGGDQSTEFSDPISYFGTNGLIAGILIYCAFGAALRNKTAVIPAPREPASPLPVEAKVG